MLPYEPAATVDPSPREDTRLEGGAAPLRQPARERPPAPVLLARIVERHHACERALPYVVALLARVAGCHRRRNAKLGVLCDVGQELADVLDAHREEEERELFPAILAGGPGTDAVRTQVELLGRHHRALGLLLARIRWLADDFAVPPWGGRSYQALMEELEALEEGVLEHVHLEGAVLDAWRS